MLVFVYGTLKRGFGNNRTMQYAEGKFVGTSEIRGYGCINRRGFPYAVKDEKRKILGEVFEVSDEKIWILDQLEGYPNFYNRELVETAFGKAFIYFIEDKSSMKNNIEEYGWTEEWNG